MAEEEQFEGFGFAMGIPSAIAHTVGEIITSEGTKTVVEILAVSEEAVDQAVRDLQERFHVTAERIPINSSSAKSFGFDSRRWGGSNWEPQGPKRNWGYTPGDDSRN